MKYIKEYLPVISVFCLALVVRIVYNLTVAKGYTPIYDAGLYNILADNILDKHCFCLGAISANPQTISRPPLWPLIMAIIYFFTGQHTFYARLFYCFLGSGTCVLIYIFARDLFGRRIALYTGMLAAIYTGLFIWDGWLFTESLYTFCLLAFAYSLYRLQRSISSPAVRGENRLQRWLSRLAQHKWAISCGIWIGLASLTRPNGLTLFGLLFLWAIVVIWAKIMNWQAASKNFVLIALIAVIIIAPWTYRNYTLTHQFIPVSLGLGTVLMGAYNDRILQNDPSAHGMWRPPFNTLNQDKDYYTPQNDHTDTLRALQWIRTHLSVMPYLLGLHFINMWIPYTFVPGLPMIEFPDRTSTHLLLVLINVMTILMYLLGLAGLLFTWKRWKAQLLVVYLAIIVTTAENVVFYSNMRFRTPVEPFLVLLAGGGLWWLTGDEPGTLRSMLKKRQPGTETATYNLNQPVMPLHQ
ncbi:MAG TPA: phospholipid carrier-dependent glycosyltransferase [Ktedonobacteraceae bacterium]|nr:phospholipid carrier-dependent glycosyltransferase [Ktedonobacteraceae bacterium]